MPKLGELLSGILSDLTESRVMADAISRDFVEAYRNDPILSQVPVPRVTVRDVTLRLRFAVNAHQSAEPPRFDEAEAARMWRKELTANVVTNVLREALADDPRRDQSDDLAAEILTPTARVQFRIGDAMGGKTQHTVAASVEHVLTSFKKLPPDVRKRLPAAAALRRELTASVRSHLDDFASKLKSIQDAKQTGMTRLDVLVRPADLKEIPENAIQEITLTLALDDLTVVDQPSPRGSEG